MRASLKVWEVTSSTEPSRFASSAASGGYGCCMMRLGRRMLVATGLSLLVGCDPRSNVSDKNKVTHHLPSEVMAVIPGGGYLATAPLLAPGEKCNGEMRRQLDKLVDLGQVWPQAKQKVAGFAIDKQVVSCRDYLECIRQKGCKPDKYESYETLLKNDSSICRNDEACVPVDQAEAYCAWRGRQLPTFVQWQVAVRGAAGDGTVDAQCRQRGYAADCQVVSSFGVLVSESMGSLYDDHEEITRSLDCFPVMLMGYREEMTSREGLASSRWPKRRRARARKRWCSTGRDPRPSSWTRTARATSRCTSGARATLRRARGERARSQRGRRARNGCALVQHSCSGLPGAGTSLYVGDATNNRVLRFALSR